MEKVKFISIVVGFCIIMVALIRLLVFVTEQEQQTKPEYELILINQDTIQVKEISTGTTVKCNPDSLVLVLEDLNK